MKESKRVQIYFLIVTIVLITVFLVISYELLTAKEPFFVTYPPANTTYTDANYTSALHLTVQTVPTVINGITAVTSIIVAFTGGYIGILLREIRNKTKEDAAFRIFLMIAVPGSIGVIISLDVVGYVNLLQGGTLFISSAVEVLGALLWALIILLGTFLFVGYELDKQESEPCSETNQPPIPQSGTEPVKEKDVEKERDSENSTKPNKNS